MKMKKYWHYLLYISFLTLIIFGYYHFKKIFQITDEVQEGTSLNMNTSNQMEIEILNACNIDKIAKRYKKYLLLENNIYDVKKTGNTTNQDESQIILNSYNVNSDIIQLANLLGIKNKNIITAIKNNPNYDITIIIGNNYKLLQSYEQINSPRIDIYVRGN